MSEPIPTIFQDVREGLAVALDESDVSEDLTDEKLNKFDELVEDALEKANCDHETVGVSCNPKDLERPASALFDGQPTEGYVRSFRASCKDCGKELSARMNIEVQR